MRLPELCLALLYAAGSGAPRAARERPLGRGEPGAARVDPRQAWMLLAGSPGRGSGDRGPGSPGKTSSGAAQAGGSGAGPASPALAEELLRELQLLLTGAAKMCRTAREGCKEEESSKGSPQARAQRRVEAAFHCQTREDIVVEKMWQELGLFYIDSTPSAARCTLVSPATAPRPCRGRLGWSHPLLRPSTPGAAEEEAGMPREPPAGADLCAVLLPAQQPSGEHIPAGEQW
ncbi:uncharacterized protein [Taeniopygia guttata]|uniref:uncharacterized protein isoform X2 n=1 Tax=Taeniopygia guttata TaxID=59729 RepID=UPI003BB99523